jgi:hypothetical protein
VTLPTLAEITRTAHWGWDEHRYFGHRVFEELTGNESLTGLLALSILGRRVSIEERDVLDDAAAALTLADPRIWPLKLTRVVAAYGGSIAALAAGVVMQTRARIGPWAVLEGARALKELHDALAGSPDPERVRYVVQDHLASHGFVWGFGTPFRPRDERLIAFRVRMCARGRDRMPYWTTMDAITVVLREARHVEPNVGIALAAVLLDMGLTVDQIGALVVGLTQHMFFAHAVEGATSTGPLRKMPDEYVTYRGTGPRESPRAQRTGV